MSIYDGPDRLDMENGLAEAYERLRPWARDVLQLLVARFGPLPAEQEELARPALQAGLSGAHVRAGLRMLQSCGLVDVVPKAWREQQNRVPKRHLSYWQEELFPRLEPEAEDRSLDEGEGRYESGDAVKDVLQVLLAASRGELKLLKQGALSAQSVRRLEQSLLAKREELEAGCPAGAAVRQYGPAVAGALHMAAASGLLQVAEGYLRPVEEAVAAWMEKPCAVLNRELFAIWKKAAAPNLRGWEFHALYAVEQAEPGRWYALQDLFDWLRVCGMIDLDCMAQMDFISTRLVPLSVWGWLCLERRASGMAFMLPACVAARQENGCVPSFAGIIVQPDLEIIVPPSPPPALWQALLHWGEWTVRGDISVFRLTPRSMGSGRKAGGSAEELIRLLRDCSKTAIDDGVIRFIREQGGSNADASAARVKQPLGTVRYMEPVFGQEAGEAELLSGTVHTHSEAVGVEPLPAGVPAAWWTLGGRGHPSTEKEMVRRAITMKTALRMETADGELMVVPLQLVEEAEDWELCGMSGRLEVRLKPRDWTGLRLVWPGIHE